MPRLTMSLTSKCPEAKAIELGGVETGSMKAYEQPTVPGIIKYSGCTLRRMAWAQDGAGETTTWRSIEKPQQEMETEGE